LHVNGSTVLSFTSHTPGGYAAGKLIDTNALSLGGGFVSPTATLDIGNNAMIVRAASGITVNQVGQAIAAASDFGSFDLPGITSSAAANDPSFATTVGWLDNSQTAYGDFTKGVASFDNGNLDGFSADILIKYTYYGDANLDGIVDGQDIALLKQGLSSPSNQTWLFGDFNADGVVDGTDISLLKQGLSAYNGSGSLGELVQSSGSGSSSANPAAPSSATLTPAAVPEPGTIGLLATGMLGVFLRRRRKAMVSAV